MEFRHALLTACIIASMSVHADDGVPASPDPQDSGVKPARDPDAEPAAKLEDVIVTAVPIGQTADEIVTPVSVLAGEALDDARTGTIGQTVAGVPGVQSTSFGAGVGRPVIRGMDGPRVKILSDGWTAVTRDRTLSAQAEHSIGITETGNEIFTGSPRGLFNPLEARR